MTDNEIKWAIQALKYAQRYDDCEPDVGMGLSLDMLLDMIIPFEVALTTTDRITIIRRTKEALS